MTEQEKADKNKRAKASTANDSSVATNGASNSSQPGAEAGDEDIDIWAAAMAEQSAQEEPSAAPDSSQDDDDAEDLWAAAMAEQAQAPPPEEKPPPEPPKPKAPPKPKKTEAPSASSQPKAPPAQPPPRQPEAEAAGERVFRPLEQSNEATGARDLAMILDIPVRLSVELGRTKVTIKQLLEMAQGSVVELDGLAGEPMDILINGYLIAQGEVVVVEDKYGIRITEIVTPSERVQKLNR